MTTLSLPSPAKIRATNFSLQRLQAFNPLRGGNHQAVDMGEPLWVCDIETTPLSRAQAGVWKYFLASLRGKLRRLFLWDASRARPLAYAAAADGAQPKIGKSSRIGQPRLICSLPRAWGAPRITFIDRVNGRLRLEQLAANAVISEGDYGHWNDGPTRRLHICAAAVADSAGRAWVSVEPVPPDSVNLPAGFEMHHASAEFAVLQSQAPFSGNIHSGVTLQAAQVLARV